MLIALAAAMPCKPAREPAFAYRPQPKVAPVVCDCDILKTVAWNDALLRASLRHGVVFVPAMGQA